MKHCKTVIYKLKSNSTIELVDAQNIYSVFGIKLIFLINTKWFFCKSNYHIIFWYVKTMVKKWRRYVHIFIRHLYTFHHTSFRNFNLFTTYLNSYPNQFEVARQNKLKRNDHLRLFYNKITTHYYVHILSSDHNINALYKKQRLTKIPPSKVLPRRSSSIKPSTFG